MQWPMNRNVHVDRSGVCGFFFSFTCSLLELIFYIRRNQSGQVVDLKILKKIEEGFRMTGRKK